MSGHVFHPGHEELHGTTVVVETQGFLTYVGRYDRQDERGLHLLDVGVHNEQHGQLKREYIEKSARFGVRSEQRHICVPVAEVARITRLASWNEVLPSR